MREYFYAGGDGPVSLEVLQNQKYRDILSIRLYYDWHTYVLFLKRIDATTDGPLAMLLWKNVFA